MDNRQTPPPTSGIRRRGFLSSIGAGMVGATVAGRAAPPEQKPPATGLPVPVTLNINGHKHRVEVEPRWTLLFVLREKLGLTGTKSCCERGECGMCTVLIDGMARSSCLTLVQEAEGHEITTIEGLMRGEQLGPVQQAFVEQDGLQCGYCTPGQVMSAEALLRRNPNPSPEEIRQGMSGTLCRCGAYDHIFKSVHRAAQLRKGGAA